MWVKIVKTCFAQAKRVWPPISQKKNQKTKQNKKNKMSRIYLATVQATQHEDNSVRSVTLTKVSQNLMSNFSVTGRMPYFGHFQPFWTK